MPPELPEKFNPDFKHDCAQCAAMCCVAHKLDEQPDVFAFDKQAGEVCAHLTTVADNVHQFQCGIWDRLEDVGCKGCLKYRCGGAGQVVTQMFVELGLPAVYKRPAGMDPDLFRWLDTNRHNLFGWSMKKARECEQKFKDEYLSEDGRDMVLASLELALTEISNRVKQEGQTLVITEAEFNQSFDMYFLRSVRGFDIAAE